MYHGMNQPQPNVDINMDVTQLVEKKQQNWKDFAQADSGQKLIATGDGEVAKNSELCKANFVGGENENMGG